MKRGGPPGAHGSVFIRDFHVAPRSGDLARAARIDDFTVGVLDVFTVAGQRRIQTGFAAPGAPTNCGEMKRSYLDR
jgi:hypothetical protein